MFIQLPRDTIRTSYTRDPQNRPPSALIFVDR
jgi:hypothetical protein